MIGNKKGAAIIAGIILLVLSNGATYYVLSDKYNNDNMEDIELAWNKGEDNYRGFVISNFIEAGRYCEPVRVVYNPKNIKEISTPELIIHNDNRQLGYFLDVEAENNDGDYQMVFVNEECITNEN